MTQGTHTPKSRNNNNQIIDFDALLYKRATKPAVVKLGGREWQIRRDFTPQEVIEYWRLVAANGDESTYQALGMLFGDAETGKAFDEVVKHVPAALNQKIYRDVLVLAGLQFDESTDDDASGESSAS